MPPAVDGDDRKATFVALTTALPTAPEGFSSEGLVGVSY